MAVARASSAESIRTGTEDPYTFNFTPAGTPRAIVIGVVHGVTATRLVTGLTYGGVTMTQISGAVASDTANEPGFAEMWILLGTDANPVPTGVQTVSATGQGSSTTDIFFVVWELSASGNILGIIDSDNISNNAADPTRTLTAGGLTKISLCAMYGGGAAPGGTLSAGNTLDHTHDLGAFYAQSCYETTVDNADHTIGWSTLASDDLAFVCVAIAEIPQFEITGWRFRNDDGNETTATWMEPELFPIHNVALDTTMRVRFRIKETTGIGVTDAAFQFRRMEVLAGTWATVHTVQTSVRAVASANVTDADATTEQLTGGAGTFVAGEITEDGLIDTQTIGANEVTEFELVFQYRSADIALSDNGVAIGLQWGLSGTAINYATGVRECVIQIGGDLWWTEGTTTTCNRFAGPHVTSGGDLYVVGMTHHNIQTVDPRAEEQEWFIWKSTDDGSTWHIVGFVPMTCSLDDGRTIGMTDATIVNDILYFSFHEQGNSVSQEVYLWAWDCVNDEIEFAEELVIDSITTANCLSDRCSIGIGVRSGGTVVMTQGYNNSGGTQEVNVFRRTGVATYASTSIATLASTNAGGYMHTDDNFHIVYLDGNATALDITHIVYKSDNTLSSADVIASTGGTSITLPIKTRIVKAFNKLFTAQIASGGLIRAWYSDGIGEDLGWTSVDLTNAAMVSVGTLSRTYILDAFGGRVVVTWTEDSDKELFYQQWRNGPQDFDTEVGTTDVESTITYDFNMFTSSANDVKLAVASVGTGKVINLRFFSAGAPVDEGGGAAATFSGWWGFIQGW